MTDLDKETEDALVRAGAGGNSELDTKALRALASALRKERAEVERLKTAAGLLIEDMEYIAGSCEDVARTDEKVVTKAEARTWRVTGRLIREGLAKFKAALSPSPEAKP